MAPLLRRLSTVILLLGGLWVLSVLFPKAQNMVLAPIRMAQGVGVSVELANLRKAVLAFHMQQGRYPTVQEMRRVVSESFDAKGRDPHYDMWGTPYYYEYHPHGFLLSSAGPDKQHGTGDDLALDWSDKQ